MEKIDLFIIDPQFDFCDTRGALYVPNSVVDMIAVAQMIENVGDIFNQIHVSLDMHEVVDVSHAPFWVGRDGENPDPFTIISHKDVQNGKWSPVIPGIKDHMLDYLRQLDNKKKYPLCVWPTHCVIGSKGCSIIEDLSDVLIDWSEKKGKNVNNILKGDSVCTEHYSALEAEVPNPGDPSTELKIDIVDYFSKEVDKVLVCGEAGSHCVLETVRSMADNFENEDDIKKIWWLENAISPVRGFEDVQKKFVEEMQERGMNVGRTNDVYTLKSLADMKK